MNYLLFHPSRIEVILVMRSGHIGAPCQSRYGREEGSWVHSLNFHYVSKTDMR